MQNNENAGGVAILVKSFEQKTRIEISRGKEIIYIYIKGLLHQLFHLFRCIQMDTTAFSHHQLASDCSTSFSEPLDWCADFGHLKLPRWPAAASARPQSCGDVPGRYFPPKKLACLTHCFDLDKRWLVWKVWYSRRAWYNSQSIAQMLIEIIDLKWVKIKVCVTWSSGYLFESSE